MQLPVVAPHAAPALRATAHVPLLGVCRSAERCLAGRRARVGHGHQEVLSQRLQAVGERASVCVGGGQHLTFTGTLQPFSSIRHLLPGFCGPWQRRQVNGCEAEAGIHGVVPTHSRGTNAVVDRTRRKRTDAPPARTLPPPLPIYTP